jgi:hypothetical protein
MGPVMPWKVTMSDLFLTGMAILCLVIGGIEVAGLSANSGVLGEMLRSKATTTCWAVTHLVPPNMFAFSSGRHVSYVFLAF